MGNNYPPARKPRAPTREPARYTGTMDGPNFSEAHTDNIIGDINAGRSTRNRPNGATTLSTRARMSTLEMLGRSMWEIMRMSKKLDEIVDRENKPHATNHDSEIITTL